MEKGNGGNKGTMHNARLEWEEEAREGRERCKKRVINTMGSRKMVKETRMQLKRRKCGNKCSVSKREVEEYGIRC